MELILEKDLEHQQKAIVALASVFEGAQMSKPDFSYENPTLNPNDICISHNISMIQQNIRNDYQGCHDRGNYLNLDVKMETGTEKHMYTHNPCMNCINFMDSINLSLLFRHCPSNPE